MKTAKKFILNKDGNIVAFKGSNNMLYNDVPIEELKLSARSSNSLKGGGYNFVSQIYGVAPQELQKIKNMGKTSVKEVFEKLENIMVINPSRKVLTYQRGENTIPTLSILDFAKTIQNDRAKTIFLRRIHGETLDEIAGDLNPPISKEWARQIWTKLITKKNVELAEDKYLEAFEKYYFSKKDFLMAYDEKETTYNYLSLIAKKGSKPLKELAYDEDFSEEMREGIRKINLTHQEKYFIEINGALVKRSNYAIAEYVIQHFPKFKEVTTIVDFLDFYNEFLLSLNLKDYQKYMGNIRTYENFLSNLSQKTLWTFGRRFRYYNMEANDYSELFETLDLNQYQNAIYSTKKFFVDYPHLMERYGIRDEYELHNLLRKQLRGSNKNITFGKMPTIEFGKSDRDAQVTNLLMRLAPVASHVFAAEYEREYGTLAVTVLANHMKNFDKYYYKGFYNIDTKPLPQKRHDILKALLTEDYYNIEDIKKIYRENFPNSSDENINPHTLKALGFKVYEAYVVKNTYPSAAQYFRDILTEKDEVYLRNLPKGLMGKASFSSQILVLKNRYEIIEHQQHRYYNIRALEKKGCTVEKIRLYCDAVYNFASEDEYFTIRSLRKSGFSHPLEELNFSEFFYSALVAEDKRIKCQNIGGTKVFLTGAKSVFMEDFLTYILKKKKSTAFKKLVEILEDTYGLSISVSQLTHVLRTGPFNYDTKTSEVSLPGN